MLKCIIIYVRFVHMLNVMQINLLLVKIWVDQQGRHSVCASKDGLFLPFNQFFGKV